MESRAASTTTVQLRKETLKLLGKHRDPFGDKSWDDVIAKLVSFHGEVYVDVIMVDGEFGRSSNHEIIFQIGNDPPQYYRYKAGQFQPLEALPKIKMEVKQ